MVVEISVAVIAVAFVVLVVYIVRVLKTFQETLQSVNKTVERIDGDWEMIREQSVDLLQETKALAADLNQKSRQLDSLFVSVKDVGNSVNQVSSAVARQAERHREQLGNLLAITGFGLETWQKWKEMKRREPSPQKEDA